MLAKSAGMLYSPGCYVSVLNNGVKLQVMLAIVKAAKSTHIQLGTNPPIADFNWYSSTKTPINTYKYYKDGYIYADSGDPVKWAELLNTAVDGDLTRIDLDSFARFYCFSMFTMPTDGLAHSLYLHATDDLYSKLAIAAIWDTNMTLDLHVNRIHQSTCTHHM